MIKRTKLYVDSCCFIDLVKHVRGMPLSSSPDEQQRRTRDCWFLRGLCDASRDGDIKLITSMLTVAECLHVEENPGPSEETKQLFIEFLTSGSVVELYDPDIFVAEKARSLWWDDGIHLKGADAMHVATAMLEERVEFFTLDHRISRASKFATAVPLIQQAGLNIRRPSDTVSLPSKHLAGNMFEDLESHDGDETAT